MTWKVSKIVSVSWAFSTLLLMASISIASRSILWDYVPAHRMCPFRCFDELLPACHFLTGPLWLLLLLFCHNLSILIYHLIWPFLFTLSQYIQEEGDDSCIDQVGEHGSDDGNDEERLDGIAVFVTYGTHVGHCIGGCAKAETAHACT